MTEPIEPVPVPLPTPAEQWKALIERTFWTYVQAFITLLLAGLTADNVFDINTWQAAALAALPALASFITGALPTVAAGNPILDILLRAVRTFAVTFLGFIAGMQVFEYSPAAWKIALVASFTAALAGIKGGLSTLYGNPDSGALLTVAADPMPMPLVAQGE